MGEVYRAEDISLSRQVALKFLAAHLLNDQEARRRFMREAKSAAALHHPHICTVHEIAEVDGKTFLVMAYLEGESLEARIAKGPLPLRDALDIGRHIAEGLEAAHEKGVVHRDIKPANVMIDAKGRATILDFGLARLTEASQLTRKDQTVGTAAYMSPEQLQGGEVDRRTDIWALGCVLYEMVAGARAFPGQYEQALAYEIVHEEPEPLTGVRAGVPMELEFIVGKCLAKDPSKRYAGAADLAVDLAALAEKQASGRSRVLNPSVVASKAEPPRPIFRARLPWTLFATALLALAGLAYVHFNESSGSGAADAGPRLHTVINLPESAPLALGTHHTVIGVDFRALALSPDGRSLVYVGEAESGSRLYYQDLTSFEEARPIEGTEGAAFAFFSPTSNEVGFLTADRVKKASLDGGPVTTLCQVRTPVAASWIDDTIYFTGNGGVLLLSVPESGGVPTLVLDHADQSIGSALLPGGGKALVGQRSPDSSSRDYARLRIVSLEGGDDNDLGIVGYSPQYVASGHLAFVRGDALMVAPFDVERLDVTGEPTPLIEGVAVESTFGQVHFDFAANGMLAYVPGGDVTRGRLAWVDREGNRGVFEMPARSYGVFDLAPDDRRFAIHVPDVRDHIQIWDQEQGGRELPLQTGAGWPIWRPDGAALAFAAGDGGVYVHNMESGAATELFPIGGRVLLDSWAGRDRIGYSMANRIGVVSAESPREPLWARGSEDGESLMNRFVAVSPDGALVAYSTFEDGSRFQVWVEEINSKRRIQVSTDGGMEPVWCRACGQLFYRLGNRVMVTRITTEGRLAASAPAQAFEAPDFVDTNGVSYRVSSDGRRLYYIRRSRPLVRDRIHIVQNWAADLD